MKKIKLLLAPCLAMLSMTAAAQAFVVSDEPTKNGDTYEFSGATYWYTIQNKANDSYVSTNNKDENGLTLTNPNADGIEAEQWCVVGDATDGYRFYNKATGAAQVLGLTYSSGNGGELSYANMIPYEGATSSTKEGEVGFLFLPSNSTADTNTSAFYLKDTPDAGRYYFNKRGNYLAYWVITAGWTTTDNGCGFKFTPADEFTAAVANVSQTLADEENSAGKPFGHSQEAYNELLEAFNQNKAATNREEATTALNDALNAYNQSSHVYPADGQKVLLKNIGREGYYVRVKENKRDGSTGFYLGSGNLTNNYRYVFTLRKDAANENNYKIYSDYFGKYVAQTPSQYDTEYDLVDNEAEAQTFSIGLGSFGVSFTDQSQRENGSLHMGDPNYRDWLPVNGGIVRWEAGSDASQFEVITDISDLEADYAAAVEAEMAKVGTAIGYYQAGDELTAAYEAFKNAVEDKGVKAMELEAALNAARIAPVAGRYYTINNAITADKVIAEDYANNQDGNNLLLNTEPGTNLVPELWQFEEVAHSADDRFTPLYNIKAANSGNYMSKVEWNYNVRMFPANNENIGKYDIYSRPNGADTGQPILRTEGAVLLVHYADVARSDFGTVADRGGKNGNLDSWNEASSDNNWTINEVTEIPVMIFAEGYATLNLPFAVNIPAEVKAYTGTETDTEVQLTEINGVIPANTPVILTAQEGGKAYDFAIAYGNTDAAISSALQGTLVPATVAAEATAYILANGNSGIGMYKVTSDNDRTIPANKAYLGSTTGTSAAAMKTFNFGQATGINGVISDNAADNTYYDLQGRRVLYPAHGVFVKGNGQKVYIK